jgi:hypothetical protein
MHDFKWSHAEKEIARRAYDDALEVALGRIIAEFKARAAAAQTPDDIWNIEQFLRDERAYINRTFDYRYSQLLMIFAHLIREGYINEARLAGLAEAKRQIVRDLLSYSDHT